MAEILRREYTTVSTSKKNCRVCYVQTWGGESEPNVSDKKHGLQSGHHSACYPLSSPLIKPKW